MQLCSLHHCVLFFLIFTFTTAPVSALEICPTRTKLHQPVTLSCNHQCSGLLQWSLLSNRDVVQAQCDQTSCKSEEGFSISHDQYLKGDSSLTITEADYSKRNEYACECDDSDFAYVRLVIETVFTPVQMKSDENLKLNVSIPELVEVIYKSGDAANEVICNVTKDSLQCKDDYRHRTSLTFPELTLRDMKPRDSGSYTIRDTKNNEDIQIYAVSVEEPGFPVWGIVMIVLIILCCCAGVGIYLMHRKHRINQLSRRLLQVEQLVQQAEEGTEENITEVEMSVNQLQQTYINTIYSAQVELFCRVKTKQLQQCRKEELNSRLLHALKLVQKAENGKKENIREAEKELKQLEKRYKDTEYLDEVSVFCMVQRSQVNWYRLQYSCEGRLMTERREVNRRLLCVDQIVQQAEEGTEEKIREADEAIDELEQQYDNTIYSEQVLMLCEVKREHLKRYKPEHIKEEHLRTEDKKLNSRVQEMEQLVLQAEEGEEEKLCEAEIEINQLELQYSNSVYSGHVSLFCMLMRAQLFWYRLLHSDEEQTMTDKTEILWKVEELIDSLQKLRDGAEGEQEAASFTVVDEIEKHLTEFKKWCEEKRGEDN
ncbi:uncharacterized protein LOC132854421 [Tachysurus vachellii]|uniref:uncharacterized protein LOC132854421 n=1 Tax=Tachysurus vachellii TaxID=175792 RepID=UPI00296B239E|nr:uncharacterized protein LOC132854421 [Tachysurus vachellii]XP_060738789.1 uncharacterized protein LOC132854421 [Tachysurus vachellii]XP_060738791.1 uncharacterized protein LOC132854421 [Tachysurus vachellii]XP_060738792.1 uncharacterized protein LOC132854421 [Tachysurus vachellii]